MDANELMRPNTVIYITEPEQADILLRWAKKYNKLNTNMIDYIRFVKDNKNKTLCYSYRYAGVYDLKFCQDNDYNIITIDHAEKIPKRVLFSLIGLFILFIILSLQ